MTERKFTDEEVIRALECCKDADCLNCPRWSKDWSSGMCNDFLQLVLDLINRQKAQVAYWMDEAANAKKETVKAFAERLTNEAQTMQSLKTGAYYRAVTDGQIEKIAREMMEGEGR